MTACDTEIGHCACGAFHVGQCHSTTPTAEPEGVKYDAGKPKWSLLPWDALREVVLVFTIGAQKYEERNWERGMAWSRVFNSMQRHATDWFQHRAERDPETSLRQIAQVAWSALVLCAFEIRGIGTDDRPGANPGLSIEQLETALSSVGCQLRGAAASRGMSSEEMLLVYAWTLDQAMADSAGHPNPRPMPISVVRKGVGP